MTLPLLQVTFLSKIIANIYSVTLFEVIHPKYFYLQCFVFFLFADRLFNKGQSHIVSHLHKLLPRAPLLLTAKQKT